MTFSPFKVLAPHMPKWLFDSIKAGHRFCQIKKRKNIACSHPEKLLGKMFANAFTSDDCSNSFYSLSEILKKYAGISVFRCLRGVIEHGTYGTSYQAPFDTRFAKKGTITMGPHRIPALKQKSDQPVYCIGPYIHYAPFLLKDEQRQQEKQRLGRNLLVFQMHSFDNDIACFDKDLFMEEILRIGVGYDSIRICLHPRDIQLGAADLYRNKGIECVSAGHIYDENFLPRLKSIIDCSEMTMSNAIGTHVGYCLDLKKPHYIFNDEHDQAAGDLSASAIAYKESALFNEIIEFLSSPYEAYELLPEKALSAADEVWGFSCIKTREEMKQILLSLI